MNNSTKNVEYHGPLEVEGYLRKMLIKNHGIQKEKTKLKYFKISLRDRKFCYKNHKSINTWRMEISLDEFIRFIPNLDDEHKNSSEFKYGFQLLTQQKYLVLFCEEELFNYDWVRVLEFIINKREMTYDHYEKFILNQDNNSSWFHSDKNLDKDSIDNTDMELEFSFSKHIIIKDENIVDASTNKIKYGKSNNDYQTFKDVNSENIQNNDLNDEENTEVIAHNSFEDGKIETKISGKKNENYPSTWDYDFEPTYVDTTSSRPIHELRKYKITKNHQMIKPQDLTRVNNSISKIKHKDISFIMDRKDKRINMKFIGTNDYDTNQMNSLNKKKKEKNKFDSDDENEHLIDLFNDKEEINDFINFNYEQLNISKLSKSKSEKLSTLPSETRFETSNSYQRDDNILDLYKELFDTTDVNHLSATKLAKDHLDFTNSRNNCEKYPHHIIHNLKNSKSINVHQINPPSLEESSSDLTSQTNTYVPKKISNTNICQNNFNSRGNSKNSKNTNDVGNLSGANTSNCRSYPNFKKDLIYDNGQLHIKQDVKKKRVNLENLNFGIDDYKKSIDDIQNALIGTIPLNNLIKVLTKNDSQLLSSVIKKKIIRKKLNHENSFNILKSFQNAPKNDNVILEESLVEEGNQWVMNVKIKIKNNEKI